MFLPDPLVLVYAHRSDVPDHSRYANWLTSLVNAPEPFALSEMGLATFLRIVTHPRFFLDPTPEAKAMDFLDQLIAQPGCRLVRPGPRHWEIFRELCLSLHATGSFVLDIFHAALALEHGCEWVTTEADYARIKGLRWRHPLM
jgi:toxin-antitoxin system PIN domain toxin